MRTRCNQDPKIEDVRKEVVREEESIVSEHSSGEASSVGGPEAVIQLINIYYYSLRYYLLLDLI